MQNTPALFQPPSWMPQTTNLHRPHSPNRAFCKALEFFSDTITAWSMAFLLHATKVCAAFLSSSLPTPSKALCLLLYSPSSLTILIWSQHTCHILQIFPKRVFQFWLYLKLWMLPDVLRRIETTECLLSCTDNFSKVIKDYRSLKGTNVLLGSTTYK